MNLKVKVNLAAKMTDSGHPQKGQKPPWGGKGEASEWTPPTQMFPQRGVLDFPKGEFVVHVAHFRAYYQGSSPEALNSELTGARDEFKVGLLHADGPVGPNFLTPKS